MSTSSQSSPTESSPITEVMPTPTATKVDAPKKNKIPVHMKNMLREKVEDAIVIVANHISEVVLRDRTFREAVVRYLYKVQNNNHSPAVFTMAYANGVWSPEAVELAIDSDSAKMFYPESSTRVAGLAKAGAVLLSIDYIHPMYSLFNLRTQTVLNLAGKMPEKVQARTKSEQIKLEVEHKFLVQMMVKNEITCLADVYADGDDFLDSVLSEAMARRESVAIDLATHMIGDDVLEACIADDLLKDVLADDRAAVKAGTPLPPMRLLRIFCGDLQCGTARSSVLTHTDVESVIEQLDKNKVGVDDGGSMITTYKDIVKKLTEKREPETTLALVIHMHGGPLCGLTTVHCVPIQAGRLADDVEEEKKVRLAHKKKMEAKMAAKPTQK